VIDPDAFASSRAALLFKGDDFSLADVEAAV
jgi:uncharacterized protein with PIN domain